jgi:2-amino-4-hydroxy-6-hydroxymethyldihydropteridine diphosphokinase
VVVQVVVVVVLMPVLVLVRVLVLVLVPRMWPRVPPLRPLVVSRRRSRPAAPGTASWTAAALEATAFRRLTEPALAYVGLGANLAVPGSTPQETLAAAVQALGESAHARLLRTSLVYVSDPVDADGPPFFNQVACLQTTLDGEALLDELQQIENRFGRERPYRNAPRTLDLDLLMLGERQMKTPRLTLPHPRMHQRLFVLMPLAELAPGLVIPGRGRVEDCLAAVQSTHTQRCTPVG